MDKMKNSIIDALIKELPQLGPCRESIEKAALILKQCYHGGGKVLVCGNGGSAADSEHIVGELMKGFIKKRKLCDRDIDCLRNAWPEDWEYLAANLQGALQAISLVSQTSINSAFANDVSWDMAFAQQVYGYGKKGDVLIGISTSGNARNVINAIKVAKAFGIKTIGMTGQNGGIMKELCDTTIMVHANEVYKVQEYHVSVYHALCAEVEAEFFME